MLLAEIKQHLSNKLNLIESIYNTIEYDLSSEKDQRAAFIARQADVTLKDLEDLGVTVPKTVKVKLNTGDSTDVKLDYVSWLVMQPSPSGYSKSFSKGGIQYFIVSGAMAGNTIGKKTVYYTGKDFNNSPDVKKFYADKSKALEKRNKEFVAKLQIDLREKLPSAAKLAINDGIIDMIEKKEFEKLHKWFEKNGFYSRGRDGELPIPAVEDFKKMGSLRGWTVSSGSYSGNRGSHGVEMKIDWDKRMFYTQGWSSDD